MVGSILFDAAAVTCDLKVRQCESLQRIEAIHLRHLAPFSRNKSRLDKIGTEYHVQESCFSSIGEMRPQIIIMFFKSRVIQDTKYYI